MERLTELREQVLEKELAMLDKQGGGGAGLRPSVLTALIAALGAALRLM